MESKDKKQRCVPLIAVGAVTLIYAAAMLTISSMNAGMAVVIFLGVLLVICGVFRGFIRDKVPRWCKAAFAVCVAVGVSLMLFLLIYGNVDNVTYDEDALIVLGAGLRGETVTDTLRMRLDAAVEYHWRNPDALIVVSGGQGKGEDISESEAMARYLVEHGVDSNIIVQESESTSTYENFVFSKRLLDDMLGDGYDTSFATSDYHVFRAHDVAKTAGFDDVSHCHGASTWYLFAPNVFRECLAVVKQCLIDKL